MPLVAPDLWRMQLVSCCGVELFERREKKKILSFPISHGLENQQKAAERQAVGG